MRDHVRVARRIGRYGALATGSLVVVLAAGGCSSASSPPSAPAGVDELVVPTPSPDPDDFVAGVDNPWLPLAPGSTWTYEARGAGAGTVTVTVEDGTDPVAGVETTAVRRTAADGTEVVDRFAQDERGNVWWFGRDGVWAAGEDGAQAGLAMPATPRVGDGWRAAYGEGVVDVRATVADVDGNVTTPAGRFAELVVIDTTDPLDPDASRRSYYARGTGLVEEVSLEGPSTVVQLEDGPS